MPLAFHRELVVDAPIEAAWHHFNRAADWPSWHTDLLRADVEPPGELGPTSVATLHARKGPAVKFRMVTFEPYRHWTWVAKLLWCTLEYDHRFEKLAERRTRIVLHTEVHGAGAGLFARIIGGAGGKSLDKALPRLVDQMKASYSVQP
jgi:hypothetical protein